MGAGQLLRGAPPRHHLTSCGVMPLGYCTPPALQIVVLFLAIFQRSTNLGDSSLMITLNQPLLRSFASLCLLSNAFIGDVQARQPTENELSAAYCLAINQEWVSVFSKIDGQNATTTQAAANENVRRIESYLASRTAELDTTLLEQAALQGRSDLQTSQSKFSQCYPRCSKIREESISRFIQCVKACENTDEGVRTQRCYDKKLIDDLVSHH